MWMWKLDEQNTDSVSARREVAVVTSNQIGTQNPLLHFFPSPAPQALSMPQKCLLPLHLLSVESSQIVESIY